MSTKYQLFYVTLSNGRQARLGRQAFLEWLSMGPLASHVRKVVGYKPNGGYGPPRDVTQAVKDQLENLEWVDDFPRPESVKQAWAFLCQMVKEETQEYWEEQISQRRVQREAQKAGLEPANVS